MKKMKGKLAFVLALIMVLGYLPQNLIVYANSQMNVNHLEVVLYPTGQIAFQWKRPDIIPGISGTTDDIRDANSTHTLISYDLFMRNASTPQAYPAAPFTQITNTTDEQLTTSLPGNTVLNNGSIYTFNVEPYHWHEVVTGYDQFGDPIWGRAKAPMTQYPPVAESAILTDIDITAVGSGDKLEVIWDDPKFDGNPVFTHYLISYRPGSDKAVFQGGTRDPHKIVSINDPELRVLPNGKLSYTIVDEELALGNVYAVRVEPMIDGRLVREDNRPIVVNGKSYPMTYSSNEYRYNNAYIRPTITVTQENEMVRISWARPKAAIGELDSITVLMSINEDFSGADAVQVVYREEHARDVNSATVPLPKGPVFFKIEIRYKDSTTQEITHIIPSDAVEFRPMEVDFSAYKPQIFSAEANPAGSMSYEITWEAFMRKPYNDNEAIDINKDLGLYEDIYIDYHVIVTDSLQNFDDPAIDSFGTVLDATQLTSVPHAYTYADDDPVPFTRHTMAYKNIFTQYAERGENGEYLLKPLEENKVYYVKIVATRQVEPYSSSTEAYFSWYIYPTGKIPSNPIMISKPPLKIADIGYTDFGIQWRTKWFEIYDDGSKTWYSLIGVDSEGNIVYGESTEELAESNKVDLTQLPTDSHPDVIQHSIVQFLGGLLGKNSEADRNDLKASLPVRFMDLSDAKYAIHVVEFGSMFEDGGFDEYYQKNLSPFSEKQAAWQMDISPEGDAEYPEYTVETANHPVPGRLSPNTAYVLYFMPYVEINGQLLVHYPGNLVVTTDTDRPTDIVEPTVPLLIPVDSTDVTATVKWKYLPDFKYELKHSELISDHEDGGVDTTSDEIIAKAKLRDEPDENGVQTTYMYFTVENLFPETRYYFWIRAVFDNPPNKLESGYSNPVDLTTKPIIAPLPPQGLGFISMGHLDVYNKENDTKLMQADYNYIIAEWLRNYEDTETVPQISAGDGSGEVIHSPTFLVSYAVKFNNLIGNRMYYIRAKTKLNIYMDGNNIVKAYTYIVQIADNEEFLDYYQIEVPTTIPVQETNKFIQKESEWCDFIAIRTQPTQGEYDGDKDPDMYPLPMDDFEITYDRATDTIIYRFRSNKTDSKGNADNLVDQRFISRLIMLKAFDFSVDVTRYNGGTAANRQVVVPYTIIKAFDERKITLSVTADNITVKLPPGWHESSGVAVGDASSVIIGLSESASKIGVQLDGGYASAPHQLSLTIQTPSRAVSLETITNQMDILLKLNNRYSMYDNNISGYVYTQRSGEWQSQDTVYDNLAGTMGFQSSIVGSYAAIAKNLPQTVDVRHSSTNAMYSVTTKMSITDMPIYDPYSELSDTQLNNIMAAVANEEKSVEINAPLAADASNALARSGMLVSGGIVSREQGISALVQLYETKTKSSLKNYSQLSQSQYYDIENAEPEYQNGLLKAGDMGFFGDSAQARPKDPLTLGDVMYITDIIMQDSGM